MALILSKLSTPPAAPAGAYVAMYLDASGKLMGLGSSGPSFGLGGESPVLSGLNPTTADDTYDEGKVWINTAANTAWICTEKATGAAVWKQIDLAGGGGDITDVIAGNGLSGGAAVGSATVNIVAADGSIVVNADDIKVGVISDTQHGDRGGGTLHANATGSGAGFMSAADKTKLDQLAASTIAFTPAGTIAATTVQAAIEEASTEALASAAAAAAAASSAQITANAAGATAISAANAASAAQVTADNAVPKVASTDNVIVRFNLTGGLVQPSLGVIDDSGVLTGLTVPNPTAPTQIANKQFVEATVAAAGVVKSGSGARNPLPTDDSGAAGFAVNSTWRNTNNGAEWRCIDATIGAAVWRGRSDALIIGSSQNFNNTTYFGPNIAIGAYGDTYNTSFGLTPLTGIGGTGKGIVVPYKCRITEVIWDGHISVADTTNSCHLRIIKSDRTAVYGTATAPTNTDLFVGNVTLNGSSAHYQIPMPGANRPQDQVWSAVGGHLAAAAASLNKGDLIIPVMTGTNATSNQAVGNFIFVIEEIM